MKFLRRSLQLLLLLAALGAPLALTACDDDPIEEAGDAVEEAVEDVGDKID